MLKRSLIVLVVSVLVALAAAAPSDAAKPVGTCPPPFEQYTFEEALAVAHQIGVPFSDEELIAGWIPLDTNSDQVLCFQDLPNTPGIPFYVFNQIDNTSSAPR